jgi:serine/threonine-protein kinase HipA
MKICPITYKDIPDNYRYSPEGLRRLEPKLSVLNDFPYTAEEQAREVALRASRMSIQGVQPKLSAVVNVQKGIFEVVDRQGLFILKPQQISYPHLPENEDLTMRLAAIYGIETPLHCLVYVKDGSFTYFIRRYDRPSRKKKLHVEDFAQLSGRSRETKYDSSMEQVAGIIEKFATFPAIENVKLFERTLFNWMIGNDDMHLKNFSIIRRDDKVELAPAYDFVNTAIVMNSSEEMALPLNGKKNKLKRTDLVDYFGKDRLKLSERAIWNTISRLSKVSNDWWLLIQRSFLPDELKIRYHEIIAERFARLTTI